MNVQPINCNNTNFNGFFKLGKINKYYPCMEESDEKIKAVIAANKDKLGEVKVMEKLPFTTQDVLLYMRNRLNITKTRLIDRYAVDKDLKILN